MVLCAALIKFDRFEWMIEKATELGVARIVPVEAARSEHGLERAAHKRVERWRRIALEASQQSRRAHLPEIDEPLAFTKRWQSRRFVVMCSTRTPPRRRSPAFCRGSATVSDEIAMLIGPEGGWTDEERAAFAREEGDQRWTAVSLGPTDPSRGDGGDRRAYVREFELAPAFATLTSLHQAPLN